jgi:hypothetical protein
LTARTPSAPPEIDDLAEPFRDDAERAESEWLLARDRDPKAPAPSSKIASDYAEMEELLRDLPSGVPHQSWHDDVLQAASSLPRTRPWWRRTAPRLTMGASLVAAAAIVVLVLVPRPPAAELEVTVRRPGAMRGSKEAVVGDHLVVTARPGRNGDLRVFRSDGTLLARCPAGPSCESVTDGVYILDVVLDAPLRYHVILVSGTSAPMSGTVTMDEYLTALRATNARVVTHEPIDVH